MEILKYISIILFPLFVWLIIAIIHYKKFSKICEIIFKDHAFPNSLGSYFVGSAALLAVVNANDIATSIQSLVVSTKEIKLAISENSSNLDKQGKILTELRSENKKMIKILKEIKIGRIIESFDSLPLKKKTSDTFFELLKMEGFGLDDSLLFQYSKIQSEAAYKAFGYGVNQTEKRQILDKLIEVRGGNSGDSNIPNHYPETKK